MNERDKHNGTEIQSPSSLSISAKKIIDFESIERYTECAFCLEQFKEPRILPCAHTYCTVCLRRMSNGKSKIKCAQCLVDHPMESSARDTDNCVLIFPKNLALQQLLDLKPTQLLSSNQCDDCKLNYAFTKCFHCTKFICLECSKAHRVNFKNDLNKLFNSLINTCNSIVDNINTDINEFLLHCNKTKLNISNTVESLINSFKLKESQLHEEIDTIINGKMR
jgi:tripartite motif-containing protein 71